MIVIINIGPFRGTMLRQGASPSGTSDKKHTHTHTHTQNPPVNAGNLRDMGSIPWLGKYPGGRRATQSSIHAWRIP